MAGSFHISPFLPPRYRGVAGVGWLAGGVSSFMLLSCVSIGGLS